MFTLQLPVPLQKWSTLVQYGHPPLILVGERYHVHIVLEILLDMPYCTGKQEEEEEEEEEGEEEEEEKEEEEEEVVENRGVDKHKLRGFWWMVIQSLLK